MENEQDFKPANPIWYVLLLASCAGLAYGWYSSENKPCHPPARVAPAQIRVEDRTSVYDAYRQEIGREAARTYYRETYGNNR